MATTNEQRHTYGDLRRAWDVLSSIPPDRRTPADYDRLDAAKLAHKRADEAAESDAIRRHAGRVIEFRCGFHAETATLGELNLTLSQAAEIAADLDAGHRNNPGCRAFDDWKWRAID